MVAAKKTSKRRSRRKTLPYVQRYRGGFRGWWMDNGRRRYTGRYPTAEQAHEEAKRRRERADRGLPRLSLTAGIELVRTYLQDQGRRSGTMRFYEGNFSIILSCFTGPSSLDEFTTEQIQRFIHKRQRDGVSANSIRHNLQVFSRIFNVGRKEGYLTRNPVDSARRPQVEDTKISVFDWHDACDIADTIAETGDTQDANTLRLILYTGLRRAEVARLGSGDLGEGRLVIEGKTSGRTLPVPAQLGKLLARLGGNGHFVPGDTEDRRCEHVRRVFARWKRRLGERRLHPHALRHTFASELAKHGVAEHVIADLLGHARKRSSVTQRYVTVFGPEYLSAMQLLWSVTDPLNPGG